MERGGTRCRAQRPGGCRLSERQRQALARSRPAGAVSCDECALHRFEDVQVMTQRRSLVQSRHRRPINIVSLRGEYDWGRNLCVPYR